MKRILLTGFDRFLRVVNNPTAQLVAHFRENPPDGIELTTHIFPVSFERVPGELETLLTDTAGKSIPYDAILMLGVATGSLNWRVETQGENADAALTDAYGETPEPRPIIENAPKFLPATFPTEAIHSRLAALGLPVTLSDSAGNYLCNHLLYRALHFVHAHTPETPAGFLHVPAAPDTFEPGITSAPVFSLEEHRRAVATALEVLRETGANRGNSMPILEL